MNLVPRDSEARTIRVRDVPLILGWPPHAVQSWRQRGAWVELASRAVGRRWRAGEQARVSWREVPAILELAEERARKDARYRVPERRTLEARMGQFSRMITARKRALAAP